MQHQKNQEKVKKKKKKSDLNEIVTEKWEHKSEEQKGVIKNIKILCESREKVIRLFNDYSKISSMCKYEAKHG